MRDLIFAGLIASLVPVSFQRPLIGLLTFSWLAYMRTQDLCWGFARNQRWSFLIAVVTFAGFFSRPFEKLFEPVWRNYVMIALAVWVALSVFMNETYSDKPIPAIIEFCKVIYIALFTTAVIKRKEHLRMMVWVIALSFGFYGVKVGLGGVLSGGNMRVKQGPGGMLEDNNNFGLALVMALPLLIQITQAERNKILKRGFMAIAPLTVVAVMATHSRGAFLSMSSAIGVLVWRSKNRMLGIVIAVLAALAGLAFASQDWIDRIKSIGDYEKDGSAMGRLAAWKTAINMTKANPIFGVGFENFQGSYWKYASGAQSEGRRVAHNAYFQIMAESGIPAYCLYMFLIVATIWSLWKIRRRAEELYAASWIREYAVMFEASMVSFIVGSTFLNRAQFDLFYHFVAIVIAFEVIALREFAGQGETDTDTFLHGGELRRVKTHGFRRVQPVLHEQV